MEFFLHDLDFIASLHLIGQWNNVIVALRYCVCMCILSIVGAEPSMLKAFREKMQPLWKKFLLNQFHDVIPGSCIEQVVIDALEIYDGKQIYMF